MKGFKQGEQVRITAGAHRGRTGVVQGERRGRLIVRLAPSTENTSQPSVTINPEMIERKIE